MKDNFIQAGERIVNLSNVSNINFVNDCKRVVFNMNYNVEMIQKDKGTDRQIRKNISDYVYWDGIDKAEIRDLFRNEYFIQYFIRNNDSTLFINLREISSIKFIKDKNRVIFNMSHPVSFRESSGKLKLTSEFVYVNCEENNYEDYVQYVKAMLSL